VRFFQPPDPTACTKTPAPACPAGSKLWIGTAVEDCCPAYRCEPDGTGCNPATGAKCGCDAMSTACTLALPYCGQGVEPIVVGQTGDCCPVYQCPCGTPPPHGTTTAAGTPAAADAKLCGCTFPNCKAGEEVVCYGKDSCGGPCVCAPAHGICSSDTQCAADERCDQSQCRLPPIPARSTAAECERAACGPELGLPNLICADGTIGGPTGRCLLNKDGTCGWEYFDCPTVGCYGICVPNIKSGCKVDSDCPAGQACSISCEGWGCSSTPVTTPGGTGSSDPGTSGGNTGSTPGKPIAACTCPAGDPSCKCPDAGDGTPPPDAACACPASDPSCKCDPMTGVCSGQTCTGQCIAKPTRCDPKSPVACPLSFPVCDNGAQPVTDGVDPISCCPIYRCPTCGPRPTATNAAGVPAPIACPKIAICACAKQTGTDPATCCPTYECGPVKADGTCG